MRRRRWGLKLIYGCADERPGDALTAAKPAATGDTPSPPKRLERGYLHVYTGTGKGKTTAAMGLAARAAGHGHRVFVLSFLKDHMPGGERETLERAGAATFEAFGREGHVNPKHPDPRDVESAGRGLARARDVITSGDFDVVILDEINTALQMGLLDLGAVLQILEKRPPHVEVVCTGRGAPLELMGLADYVTRMESIKHPYERGIVGRKGIDE